MPSQLGRAVATERYGVVVFTEISGELADASELAAFYRQLIEANADHFANFLGRVNGHGVRQRFCG